MKQYINVGSKLIYWTNFHCKIYILGILRINRLLMIIFIPSLGVSFMKSGRHLCCLWRGSKAELWPVLYFRIIWMLLLTRVCQYSACVLWFTQAGLFVQRTRPTLLTGFFYTHAHTRTYRPTYVNWLTLFIGTLVWTQTHFRPITM
jgi:hypothetical protein